MTDHESSNPEDLSPETVEQVRQAIFAGQKIQAIKIYREATGHQLVDAKKFIDALTVRLREEEPESFTSSSSSGCSTVVCVLVFAAIGLVWLW